MLSVFAHPIFRKSTLSFALSGGETVNSRGASTTSDPTLVTLTAYLVRRRVMPKTTGTETAVIGTVDLEGRLINPLYLPIGLIEGAIGTGTVNGETGTVELLPTAREGIVGLEAITGQKIRIRFSRRTQYAGVS